MINPYKLSSSQYSTHQILISNIHAGESVLDVGCNDGYIGRSVGGSAKFWGVDYSEHSIVKAKKVYQDAGVLDLNKSSTLPWDMKFNTIVFADILEHLLDPQVVLRDIVSKYLKEDGKVLVSLPNVGNWQVRMNLLFGNFDYTDSGILDRTHLHLYTYKSAIELVQKAGLKINTVMGGASVFGPIINIFSFLRGLLATNIILEAKYVQTSKK